MILPLKTPFIGDSHFRTEKPILSCPFRRIHSGFMAVDESIDVLRVRVMKMGMQWGYNQLFPTIYIYIIGIYIYSIYIYTLWSGSVSIFAKRHLRRIKPTPGPPDDHVQMVIVKLLVLVPGIEPQLTDTPNDKHEFLWIWFNHLPIADVLACISWGLESWIERGNELAAYWWTCQYLLW